MVDFAKQGYIGCPVWDPRFGNGKIAEFDLTDNFSVGIEFEAYDSIRWYTADGYYMEDELPTLCFRHHKPLNQGTPPKRPLKYLEFKGQPVWALVANYPANGAKRCKRRVIAVNEDGVCIACDDGTTENNCSGISYWEYAWEIPEDDNKN